MNKLFVICGRSGVGKDTICRGLKERHPQLKELITYTTRKPRDGEKDGEAYHFCTEEQFQEFLEKGLIIEDRSYQTVSGLARYFTVLDSQFQDLGPDQDLIVVASLVQCQSYRSYFGPERVVPLYLELDEKELLLRAIQKESMQENPRYHEVCRRFLSEIEEYSPEQKEKSGVTRVFVNRKGSISDTLTEIDSYLQEMEKKEYSQPVMEER